MEAPKSSRPEGSLLLLVVGPALLSPLPPLPKPRRSCDLIFLELELVKGEQYIGRARVRWFERGPTYRASTKIDPAYGFNAATFARELGRRR